MSKTKLICKIKTKFFEMSFFVLFLHTFRVRQNCVTYANNKLITERMIIINNQENNLFNDFDDDLETCLELEEQFGSNNASEIEGQITFDQIIKPENDFHLLEKGYYKFKVVNCERDVLPETAAKPARPIIRLRLEIENEEANVVINHIIFINEYNNSEIHSFFSAIGLSKDCDYITNWDVEGRTGGCYLVQKKLDFKTVNAIEKFVHQN